MRKFSMRIPFLTSLGIFCRKIRCKMKIAIGSDHCGYEMKMKLMPLLKDGNEVTDFGCFSTSMVDFPDIAEKVCDAILSGKCERGIMFCSTGIGAVIACNKVLGIRAGLCHDTYSAHQAVEHDNIQILAIGAEIIGYHLISDIIQTFLGARFSEEDEFKNRIAKLDHMDNKRAISMDSKRN